MNLVQEYFTLANEVISWRESVHDNITAEAHNQKVNRMRSIAVEIEQDFPDFKLNFFNLLSNENQEIRLWVAHHMLECMNYEQCFKKYALKEIRCKVRTDRTALGFGEKLWLKEWYKSHPKDRWL
jgi:hypothetical protein